MYRSMYVNKMGLYCLFKIAHPPHPPKITQAWSPGTKNSESWMGLTLTLIYSWRTTLRSELRTRSLSLYEAEPPKFVHEEIHA